MKTIPYRKEAYDLLHEGAIALAEVESVGIAVDVDYVNKALKETKQKILELQAELEKSDVMQAWRKRYRDRTNTGSSEQLGHVLFDVLGFENTRKTASGSYATDEEALSDVDHPFVAQYLEIKKLGKAVSTNLKGILKEVVYGRLHSFFNLHTTVTYRSSSDSINFQNQPIRDQVLMELIRTAFVASEGNQLVEIDFSGAEVCVASCYNKDPVLIQYILDKTKDMHRDMAMELFRLPMSEFVDGGKKYGKAIRHAAKNQFVFPQFYGDFYLSNAPSLWKSAAKCTLRDGTPLLKHMKRQGIKTLGALDFKERPQPGTFEAHVQAVEQDFWGERFKVYSEWKREWVDQYRRKGFIETLTGFICQGHMKKNEVINYAVQGSAFHCLLWSLVRLVRKELKRRQMKSAIVGQIHDSIVADVVPSELDEFLALCKRVMTVLLAKAYPWLIVPMSIEAEVSPVGQPWSKKTGYEIKD